jgi:hypothetical protein
MTSKSLARSKVPGAMAAIGLLGLAATYLAAGPQRFWANWILWLFFAVAVGLGSLFIVALNHLVGSVWSVPLRRVPERLSGLVVWSAPVVLAGLLAIPVLYPWSEAEAAKTPMVAGKLVWLNVPFFSLRVLACIGLWALSYRILVHGSLRQDESRDPLFKVKAKRFSAVFMIIFAMTITIAAFDWISSLEPAWYSDIFGVYLFAGTFLSGLAATTLAVLHLRKGGRLEGVGPDHLYNLGGFMFAFTIFWGYIGFAQYLLMWYGNMPEEIFWYKQRIEGPWLAVALLLGAARFLVPFFALISREAKCDPKRLRWVALWILGGQLLDLYWMIFPVLGKRPLAGWPELSFALFFLGLGWLWARRAMSLGEDVPVGDPFLQAGYDFHL